MPDLDKTQEKDVKLTYELYPKDAQKRLLQIRQMIFDIAKRNSEISDIEETLKWGEPAYIAKSGSTIRLAWKPSTPENCAVYFICRTKLVETFKEVYPETFTFDGNRAIIFNLAKELPELEHCLLLSLTYHKIKHLPLLGV